MLPSQSMDIRYRIQGGIPLMGDVTISGSKNAALPLLAGSVVCSGVSVFHNVPRLSDIETMISILKFLGAKVSFIDNTVTVDATKLNNQPIPHDLVSKLRGSIVLLGPLLARFGRVEMAYPGGCVLGKRPVNAHIQAFVQMGAKDLCTDNTLCLEGTLSAREIVLPEFSVTATENVILAAALVEGETTVELAAAEPHVQDVCDFLASRGITIIGRGTHTITVRGKKKIGGGQHTVISDYLEAGAFVIAGLVTRGHVRIHGVERSHLLSFLNACERMGGKCRFDGSGVLHVHGNESSLKALRVQTNIFPGFPTDLQAPFGVAMTQAQGVSRIFEVLFEGRMAYLYELEKMGAHIEILNSHQALVIGPTPLQGRMVASNDIRAGAAMVLAGLCAHGETIVTDVKYIERGYDQLVPKLQALGARITRQQEISAIVEAPLKAKVSKETAKVKSRK